MNGLDDDIEPGDLSSPSDGEPRERRRRTSARAANVCMGASFLALPMAVVDPNGWWLIGAVVGGVLYMVLSHLSIVSRERDGL